MTAPITLHPIGTIRTPFREPAGMPIQPAYAGGAPGQVVVDAPFDAALADIDGFERVWLLYWLDAVAVDRRHADSRFHGRDDG